MLCVGLLHYRAKEIYFKDLFTYASLAFGILAVTCSIRGQPYAPAFILLAVVADWLDGKVARLTGKFNEFGIQLDSLADAVSFGAAPAIVGVYLSNSLASVLILSEAMFFAICIITRLAWFNLQDPKAEKGVYYGLPSPLAAVGVIAVSWAFAWHPAAVAFSFFVFGFLAVSGFRTKKETLKRALGPLGFIFS